MGCDRTKEEVDVRQGKAGEEVYETMQRFYMHCTETGSATISHSDQVSVECLSRTTVP